MAEATFENFVITDNGEDIKFFIYSYITLDFNEELRHFLISVLPIEDNLIDVVDFQGFLNAKMHLIDGCLYNIPEDGGAIQTIWCNDGGNGGNMPTSSGGGGGDIALISNDCKGICTVWQHVQIGDDRMAIVIGYYLCAPDESCNYGENNEENNGETGGNNEQGSGQFPDNNNLGGTSGGGTSSSSGGQPAVGALPSIEQNEITLTPKEKVLECLNDNNITLTPTQLEWLNNSSNGIKIKGMSTMIGNVGCEDMIDIILEYINASPPSPLDFKDYAYEQLECYGIQELMNSAYFTSALTDLRSSAPGASSEKGYEISRNSMGNISKNFVDGSSGFVTLRHGGEIMGGMHIHHDPGELMFSAEDIYNLYQYHTGNIVNNPNQFSSYEVFTVLVTIHGTYMLKMKDKSLLGYIFQNKSLLDINGKLGHYYNLSSSSINEDDRFIKGLLKTFEYYRRKLNNMPRIPINFYKLDESIQKFDRLTLNDSGAIIKTPCN
ncbi:hypothetical protein [Formosa maritima]|uniref:Uncharacterized protein n=1 Tax=Formosa maritima TaxID=2592046 RepID=A0A5D0G049_9FLAO|nr:hypothetical protein [Formosa maritima]TYA52453.1 hypothetical protein FVF61_14040 [Formosa maritima]